MVKDNGFSATGAIYYVINNLTDNEKKITKKEFKFIPINISGQSIGYFFINKDEINPIVERLNVFRLSNQQASSFNNFNLQQIALKHYNEISTEFGEVNNLEKDGTRKYDSDFPSLNENKTISCPKDLHSILIKIISQGTHLDMGCGLGKDVLRYSQEGYVSMGMDINEIQTEGAKKLLNQNGILEEKILKYDILTEVSKFKNNFDIITCHHVYQHFTLDQALTCTENALSMLKEDGVMMLTIKLNVKDWKKYFEKGVRIQAEDLANGVFKMWDGDLVKWREGYHLFLSDEVESIITAAKGEIIDIPTYKGDRKGIIPHDSGRNYPCVTFYLRQKSNK